MNKLILMSIAFVLLGANIAYSQSGDIPALHGISVGLRQKDLVNSWGHPSEREYKSRAEKWFYRNDNTPNPTDGVIVYIERGRVKSWKTVDNIYAEMKIYGGAAGASQ